MSDKLLTRIEGPVGRITLNRPAALHALDVSTCRNMTETLLAWRDDPAIEVVMLDHQPGTRGFCAGGDIVWVRQNLLDGEIDTVRALFRVEYGLNHLLHEFPKPVISFMDGVTMGGGVGIAMPARLRVATENTLFAMPETAIGMLPDAGGGHYLPRLPGQLGKFIALTAARLDGAECAWAGIATHYLDSEDLDEAKELIVREPAAADEILRDLATPPPPARIAGNAETIDRLFAADTVEGVLASLAADPSDWAAKELAAIASKSPTAAKVAMRLLTQPPDGDDFAAEMRREFAIISRIIARPDFAEGVRAVLVDRDNAPQWQPARLEDVTDEMLDEIFAPLPADSEWNPVA